MIKSALISVSDKTGVIEFAKGLQELGVKILSTGGTFKALDEAGIDATLVSDVTQFPEMMGGRVKTLHPKIHGGILGLRDEHDADAKAHDIPWIDMVVCNLYPFAQTILNSPSEAEAIEKIDIGGPTMLRASAKNFKWVLSVCDPDDYDSILSAIADNQCDHAFRKTLSAKTFAHTARYDSMIHNYLNQDQFPQTLTRAFDRVTTLRYGENPDQGAVLYTPSGTKPKGLLAATQHQGKALSYNNYMDADAAVKLVSEFNTPACVVVKHANPCGVATRANCEDALVSAWAGDSKSAFGGVVAINGEISKEIADFICERFVEIVVGVSVSPGALEVFAKKKNLRVLTMTLENLTGDLQPRKIAGGQLIQLPQPVEIDTHSWQVVTQTKPSEESMATAQFAWRVIKYVKSNAILIARDNATLGIGPGQVSRVDAVNIALQKSGENLSDTVLASDAFFPFPDSIEHIAQTEIKTIIQPGGSIKDQAVIDACDVNGIAMIFTGQRVFFH